MSEEIKNRYSQQPNYESGYRAGLFGGDQGLKDLMGGFSNKVMELYNYDKQRSSVYNAPFKTEGGEEMMVNPMIEEEAKQGEFNNTLRAKEGAWQLYETRKNLLGSIVDKALKAYEAETKGKEIEADSLQDEIVTLVDMYKEENRKAEKQRELDLTEKEIDAKKIEKNNDVELYAQMIADDQGTIKDVPAGLRGQVSKQLVDMGVSKLKQMGAGDRTNIAFPLEIAAAAQSATNTSSPDFSGAGDVVFGKVKGAFNRAPEGFTEFQQTLAAVRTAINKSISGATLTPEERKELENLTPRWIDSDTQLADKLRGLQEYSKRKANAILTAGSYGYKYEDLLNEVLERSGIKPPLSSFDK